MWERLTIVPEREGSLFLFEKRTHGHIAHSHDELEFNLALSGNATYLVGGRKVALGPASMLWLFPADEHVLFEYSADFSMWVAVFRPSLVRSACRQPAQAPLRKKRPPPEIVRVLEPKRWHPIAEMAEQTKGGEAQSDLFNASLRVLLILAWTAFLQAQNATRPESVHPAVNRAAMLLKTDASDKKLSDISRHAGLSEAHLSRLFKEQMGLSLTDYRNQQRLRRFFAHYGESREINLLGAALDAGFGSYAQFHRVFTRHYGYTPRELRKH